jgi:uncharacterized membrane protein
MGHGHSHGPTARLGPASRSVRVVLFAVIGVLLVLTLAALAVLWPQAPPKKLNRGAAVDYLDATVEGVEASSCGPMECATVRARIETGRLDGVVVELAKLSPSAATPTLHVGDRIVITQEVRLTADAPTYSFADFQRRQPLWALVVLFAVLVIGIARWRGVAALVGLVFTWWVLVTFLLPAILAGESPIAVALTAAAVILFVVLYLAHGFNARTSTALIGTFVSLGLTGLLGWYFVGAAHLTGLTSDEATLLTTSVGSVDLSGLLLCGIIIGSLGVLNDVTVTQAASVWEIHAADPAQSTGRLYRSGMRIGRDHIASTVYTLVLAYAGASLPLLILFLIGRQRFGDVVNGEILAEEIVRTLVGSIGLVASVPITTYLAALIVSQQGDTQPRPARPRAHERVMATLSAGLDSRRDRDEGERPGEPERVDTTSDGEPPRDGSRRAARRARAAAKEQTWQPPAAERDFWDGLK